MSVPDEPVGVLIDRAASSPIVRIERLLAPEGGVLVIAPHPDDETLGCGAALAAAVAAGRAVTVALLTDGGGSHLGSRRWPPDVLMALRRAEFAAAVDALAGGAARTLRLNLVDTAVPYGDPAAVETIAQHMTQAGLTTLWATWRGDPHADHVAAATIADCILARLPRILRRDYAVWGRFGEAGAAADPHRILRFAPGPFGAAKRRAMEAYRSQFTPLIDDDPDGFVMPPALVAHFADTPEIFLEP